MARPEPADFERYCEQIADEVTSLQAGRDKALAELASEQKTLEECQWLIDGLELYIEQDLEPLVEEKGCVAAP